MQHTSDTILEFRGISKDFPGIRALNNIDFDLKKGEVHALIGENGAGKSTLIKILAGVFPPTEGQIYYKGEKVTISSPKEGIDLGISVIYQEITLVPYISIAKNIFLGREPHRKYLPFIDYKRLYRDAEKALQKVGSSVDPKAKAINLGVAEKQLVEMARAFSVSAPIIVMDEPTATLTQREIRNLFQLIKGFKKEGISIIYISHRLEEIFEIADRITVLRDGKIVETLNVDEVKDLNHIIRLMVGRNILTFFSRNFLQEKGAIVLETKNLTREGIINDVNLYVRSGEIVGLAGLVGAGRTELVRCIFGVDSHKDGEVLFFGNKIPTNPVKSVIAGIGFLPEDRKTDGLAMILPIRENILMAGLRKIFPFGILNGRKESKIVNQYVKTLRIATPSVMRIPKYLSGGNQQKVIVAKWLCTQAKLFIFDEPTRGIDVGAKAEIYQLMNELVNQGAAILMISSELPEVLNMSDRIYVMREGRIVKELAREEANQEMLLKYAMGSGER